MMFNAPDTLPFVTEASDLFPLEEQHSVGLFHIFIFENALDSVPGQSHRLDIRVLEKTIDGHFLLER